MTPADYQKRNSEIEQTISRLNSEVTQKESEAASLTQRSKQWLLNKTNPCKGTAKNKRDCENDNQYKDSMSARDAGYAKTATDIANQKKQTIAALRLELEENTKLLKEAQASASQVSATLANQGLTLDSVMTTSQAQADAIKQSATVTAQAQADAIKSTAITTADAEAKSKKIKTIVIAGVAGLIVVITLVIVVKKLKKKK